MAAFVDWWFRTSRGHDRPNIAISRLLFLFGYDCCFVGFNKQSLLVVTLRGLIGLNFLKVRFDQPLDVAGSYRALSPGTSRSFRYLFPVILRRLK